VFGESIIIMRLFMQRPVERSAEYQPPGSLEQPSAFTDQRSRVGHVFNNLAAQNDVDRSIRKRHGRGISHDIGVAFRAVVERDIPAIAEQASIWFLATPQVQYGCSGATVLYSELNGTSQAIVERSGVQVFGIPDSGARKMKSLHVLSIL
jgi:hypothetical protein